jgi:hypothetical protein
MEKTDAAAVVPLDAGWCDVGSWTALWEISPKDDQGNACKGDVLALDTRNSLIMADSRLVVSGTARVTNGEKSFLVTENQSTYIPVGQVHALENPGNIPLALIEVQSGSYLGEDDIVRLEDRYGRVE